MKQFIIIIIRRSDFFTTIFTSCIWVTNGGRACVAWSLADAVATLRLHVCVPWVQREREREDGECHKGTTAEISANARSAKKGGRGVHVRGGRVGYISGEDERERERRCKSRLPIVGAPPFTGALLVLVVVRRFSDPFCTQINGQSGDQISSQLSPQIRSEIASHWEPKDSSDLLHPTADRSTSLRCHTYRIFSDNKSLEELDVTTVPLPLLLSDSTTPIFSVYRQTTPIDWWTIGENIWW